MSPLSNSFSLAPSSSLPLFRLRRSPPRPAGPGFQREKSSRSARDAATCSGVMVAHKFFSMAMSVGVCGSLHLPLKKCLRCWARPDSSEPGFPLRAGFRIPSSKYSRQILLKAARDTPSVADPPSFFFENWCCLTSVSSRRGELEHSGAQQWRRARDLGKDTAEAAERGEGVVFWKNMILAVSTLDEALEEEAGSAHGVVRSWPARHKSAGERHLVTDPTKATITVPSTSRGCREASPRSPPRPPQSPGERHTQSIMID